MKISEPDFKKFRNALIILCIIVAVCLFLPAIVSAWLYLISLLIAGGCCYLIYRAFLEYHEQKEAKMVYDCITVKEICTVDKIAKELGWETAKTRSVVDFCFRKNYLDDYFRVGDAIRKKEESADGEVATASSKKSARKCPYCGGVAEYYEGEKATCVYCGNVLDKE